MNEDNVPETVVAEPVPETVAVAHPAGKFMWSMALGGPIIAWFFHRKELKKSAKSFFWPMFGWNFLTNMADRALTFGSKMTYSETLNIFDILSVIWFFAAVFILGRLGASKIKECLPDYAAEDYKPCERRGTILGIVLMVIVFFCSFILSMAEIA
ncbi:MAG: hypothetical protein IKT05_03420 [Fibrobacter sp.]|nr:hypothetical protein [Fibrobacter sp.]